MYLSIYFWRLVPSQMTWFPVAFLGSVVLSFWLSPRAAARWGKRRAAQWATLISTIVGLSPLVLALLGQFPANGQTLFLPLLVGSSAVAVACRVAVGILFVSMLSDQVEATELSTGVRSEGTILALGSFTGKIMSGFGLYLAGSLLQLVHFPAHAVVGKVEPQVLSQLVMVEVGVSISLALLSVWVLTGYKTERQTHQQNVSLLLQRDRDLIISS
jgi:Na+/melibiose symporter-like transporter